MPLPDQFDPQSYTPRHFRWQYEQGVATITFNNPAHKNSLTFDTYAELRDTFRALVYVDIVKTVVITGAQNNFCSGGDVNQIIGPLTQMNMRDILAFTRMTGDLVKAMRTCPQPIFSAVDGICVGAGAIIAMASDFRYATRDTQIGFVFTRVGLAGCDMGACAILPRIIGLGRAAELLFTGRMITGKEAHQWGFINGLYDTDQLLTKTQALAHTLALGPTFAHSMTKNMLHQECNMSLEQALEAEAQAQAICMQSTDFTRAYHAFIEKKQPNFEGK